MPAPHREAPAVAQDDALSQEGYLLGDEVGGAFGFSQQGTADADLHARGDVLLQEPLRADFHAVDALLRAADGQDEKAGTLAVGFLEVDALHRPLDVDQLVRVKKVEGGRLGMQA